MTSMYVPKFHRPFKGNRIGWEIYSRRCWFINIAIGSFEIQFNKWKATKDD